MCVGVRQDRQALLFDPREGLRIVSAAVDQLDAVHQLLVIQRGNVREPRGGLLPAGMIPEDETFLLAPLPQGDREVQPHERILVGYKQNIEVRVSLHDLHAGDQNDSALCRQRGGQSMRAGQIHLHVRLVRIVTGMIGDRDGVQALAPGFVDARGRPDLPVRKDRVHVKVALQGFVASDIRHGERITLLRRAREYQKRKPNHKADLLLLQPKHDSHLLRSRAYDLRSTVSTW